MKLILVGACYVDTILSVPHFPGEHDKLRATSMQVRRGGNCPNSIEVMQQLVGNDGNGGNDGKDDDSQMHIYLVSCLPDVASPSAAMIAKSLGAVLPTDPLESSGPLSTCIFRAGYTNPASCYIIRSAATGSRTIVNHNDLPEMTLDEFKHVVSQVRGLDNNKNSNEDPEWWHFEGRIPETLLQCFHHLRESSPKVNVKISLEVEKPGRPGLRALAKLADIVFYSKTWAESEGYTSSEACVRGEVALMKPTLDPSNSLSLKEKILFCTWGARGASVWHAGRDLSVPAPYVPAEKIVDAVGAGDTFTAGILYKLSTRLSMTKTIQSVGVSESTETIQEALEYAVSLASRKIQLDGFQGLA